MNKIPKIIKRQPPKAVEAATNWVSSEEPSASEVVEPAEVPTPKEAWEALYMPPSTTISLREWQREFREVEWQNDAEAWESQFFD